MEIQVLRENLAKTIQLAARFALQKTQLPILSHVAIEATKAGIYVIATNLDMTIKLRMPGKMIKEGGVTVPAKLMSELANSLSLGSVTITADESMKVSVVGDRSKSSVPGMNWADFPPAPTLKSSGEMSLSELSRIIERVGYVVSTDEARPVLTGMVWDLKQKIAVATDGYRLSMLSQLFVGLDKLNQDLLIIPGKALQLIYSTLNELQVEKVGVGFIEPSQQLSFQGEDVEVVVRLISGEFPNYRAIMPSKTDFGFRASRESLIQAVKLAAIFSRESANIIKLAIDEKTLVISANSPQVGEQEVGVEIEKVGTGVGQIAFNSKYLLDFLSHSESSEVEFGMTEPLKPGLFTEVGDTKYVHVIMPVRVK